MSERSGNRTSPQDSLFCNGRLREPLSSTLRTPEQMEWINDRFKIDALARLARSTPDYYESKGYYLPDVAALAHAALLALEAKVEEVAVASRALDLASECLKALWVDASRDIELHWREAGIPFEPARCAIDGARAALQETERPQPRAEAVTALTTAEDGTPHSPVPHVGAAATAENVAPKRPPSEPEPKPAADTTAAGSITGSTPAGGLRNEKKIACGCYVAYGQGNERGVWSICAVAFLCDKGHRQGDITEVFGA